MRKQDSCLCENKDADQLCSNCTADLRLCFHDSDSTIALLLKSQNSKSLAFFCDCTGWFVSDLVGNPKDRFSRIAAHIVLVAPRFATNVRKPDFCLCENKDIDQLCSNCKADQRLCFRNRDSTVPLLSKSKISSL